MFCIGMVYILAVPLHYRKRYNTKKMFNRTPKRGAHKDETNMNKNQNQMILMLQYRIQRYQAMGNGTMCQNLISQLNKLQGNNMATAN